MIEVADTFDRIYQSATWGVGSGPGSHPYFTIEYRLFLEKFIHLNGIASVIDFGCGDWQFSRFLNLAGVTYLGLDVVEALIKSNRDRFGSRNVEFKLAPDNLRELPHAELIVVKDVLQHLPNSEIQYVVECILSRCRFALVTNSYEKESAPHNIDVGGGGFRSLDLTSAPYNFEGAYVLEFWVKPWERVRTLLMRGTS